MLGDTQFEAMGFDSVYQPRSDSLATSEVVLFSVVSVCGRVGVFVCQHDNS